MMPLFLAAVDTTGNLIAQAAHAPLIEWGIAAGATLTGLGAAGKWLIPALFRTTPKAETSGDGAARETQGRMLALLEGNQRVSEKLEELVRDQGVRMMDFAGSLERVAEASTCIKTSLQGLPIALAEPLARAIADRLPARRRRVA